MTATSISWRSTSREDRISGRAIPLGHTANSAHPSASRKAEARSNLASADEYDWAPTHRGLHRGRLPIRRSGIYDSLRRCSRAHTGRRSRVEFSPRFTFDLWSQLLSRRRLLGPGGAQSARCNHERVLLRIRPGHALVVHARIHRARRDRTRHEKTAPQDLDRRVLLQPRRDRDCTSLHTGFRPLDSVRLCRNRANRARAAGRARRSPPRLRRSCDLRRSTGVPRTPVAPTEFAWAVRNPRRVHCDRDRRPPLRAVRFSAEHNGRSAYPLCCHPAQTPATRTSAPLTARSEYRAPRTVHPTRDRSISANDLVDPRRLAREFDSRQDRRSTAG